MHLECGIYFARSFNNPWDDADHPNQEYKCRPTDLSAVRSLCLQWQAENVWQNSSPGVKQWLQLWLYCMFMLKLAHTWRMAACRTWPVCLCLRRAMSPRLSLRICIAQRHRLHDWQLWLAGLWVGWGIHDDLQSAAATNNRHQHSHKHTDNRMGAARVTQPLSCSANQHHWLTTQTIMTRSILASAAQGTSRGHTWCITYLVLRVTEARRITLGRQRIVPHHHTRIWLVKPRLPLQHQIKQHMEEAQCQAMADGRFEDGSE